MPVDSPSKEMVGNDLDAGLGNRNDNLSNGSHSSGAAWKLDTSPIDASSVPPSLPLGDSGGWSIPVPKASFLGLAMSEWECRIE